MNEERCDQMDCKTFDSIRIETAGAEDMNEIRKLWKQSFDDQDAYMDYYFSTAERARSATQYQNPTMS